MLGKRLHTVARARRLEPAAAASHIQQREQRRKRQLVNADQESERAVEHDEGAVGSKIEARCANFNHSPARSAALARAAVCRATMTNQHPGLSCGRLRRTASRSRRRTRLRTTAPPTRRDVTKPIRLDVSGGAAACKTPSTRKRPGQERPLSLTRRNSPARVSRAALGKRRRGGRWGTMELGEDAASPGASLKPACAGRTALPRPSATGACNPTGGAC